MDQKKAGKIPGYKAVAILGKGSQGVVYKGVDESTGASVAIKILSPKMAKVPEYKARFLRETQVTLSLTHPNIVKGLKSGLEGDLLYYVMEFAEGKSLNDLVNESGPLPEPALLSLGIQAADALGHAHAHNLVHRDVKPGNFIVSPAGRIMLLDLGLAKDQAAKGELTMEGSIFGTPNYISPEAVHDSKAVTARSDIYSLGATLYKAAVGKPPFEGINPVMIMQQVCTVDAKPPRSWNPKLSEGLERVILHAMEKRPDDRYATAGDMKADLERLQRGEPPLAARAAKRKSPTRGADKGKGAAAPGKPAKRASTREHVVKKGFFARILAIFGFGKS
jgi:eukaryotic-like serine/threonine-protein kinase